jgi:hypothetical protein
MIGGPVGLMQAISSLNEGSGPQKGETKNNENPNCNIYRCLDDAFLFAKISNIQAEISPAFG